MKFFAVLKDSLRESIDAKVFYVMVGLSLLLILVGLTATFPPKDGGEMVMKMAAVPLSVDLSNLDVMAMQAERAEGDPTNLAGLFTRLRGTYQVEKVEPLDGAPDLPTSTFRVVVRPAATFPFLFGGPKPEKAIQQIRERFGQWDDRAIAEVLDVRHEKGSYVVDARVTAAGAKLWPHGFSLFFGALPVVRAGVPLGAQLYWLETILVNQIGAWVTILISVIITAFFIPNMLRKGTIDMLLVKPMRRTTLLLYKYVGGLLFIFLNTALAVGGVWLALSWRSGLWAPGFLLAIPTITFFFAILYAVSTLFAVLTRSPVVSILMTCGAWFFLFVVGTTNLALQAFAKFEEAQVRRQAAAELAATAAGMAAQPSGAGPLAALGVAAAENERRLHYEVPPGVFARVVRGVHFVLPRTGDLDRLMTAVLQRDLLMLPRGLSARAGLTQEMTWGESLTVSAAFIAVVLGLSCWWFATRDY